ncbi:MAG TPA: FAD-binding oxidoreductase, partial [bacterium]|nr:FAD-binding oxidoreductase [bacterium]
TRLESVLGRQAVQEDTGVLAAHAVDGMVPSVRVAPQDAAQIGDVLKVCSEEHAAVVPWGGGTSIGLGNRPSRVDVVLSLERLNALIEHDDANLTATVQAGMRVAALQQILSGRGQFLAIDPPLSADATIGGVVAANTNGPRRMHYGGVRDQVIGMKCVLATGEQVKTGGKVVKNVAGYDMSKLFTGSLGTIGVITEATFRMAPVPERSASLLASGTIAQALKMVEQIKASVLLPSAVTVLNARAAHLTAGSGIKDQGSEYRVLVWVEGFAEAVERHLNDLRAMAKAAGLSADTLEDSQHHTLWKPICDFGSTSSGVLYRLTLPLGAIGEAISTVETWSPTPQIVAHMGAGTLWVAAGVDGIADWVARLSALATAHRGHAIVAAAPPHVKEVVDVWGSPPPGLSVMEEIKRQFDPAGILNPGRFVARL